MNISARHLHCIPNNTYNFTPCPSKKDTLTPLPAVCSLFLTRSAWLAATVALAVIWAALLRSNSLFFRRIRKREDIRGTSRNRSSSFCLSNEELEMRVWEHMCWDYQDSLFPGKPRINQGSEELAKDARRDFESWCNCFIRRDDDENVWLSKVNAEGCEEQFPRWVEGTMCWITKMMRMNTTGLVNQIAGKLRLKSVAVHGWWAVIDITESWEMFWDTIFLKKNQPNILPSKFEASFTSRSCDVSSLSYSRNSLVYSHCSRYVECIILKPSHNLPLVGTMSSGARDEQANLNDKPANVWSVYLQCAIH